MSVRPPPIQDVLRYLFVAAMSFVTLGVMATNVWLAISGVICLIVAIILVSR